MNKKVVNKDTDEQLPKSSGEGQLKSSLQQAMESALKNKEGQEGSGKNQGK